MKRVTVPLFKIGLASFLVLGVLVVLAQAVGVLTGDTGLVSGVLPTLGKAMTVVAGITGLLAFAMSYLFGWESGGDD